MIAPATIEKLKAGFNNVAPDDPEAAPVLEALDEFLHRWFAIGLKDALAFTNASMARHDHPKAKADFTVYVEADAGESLVHSFTASFEGFGIDGLLTVEIPREAMEGSRCIRFVDENTAIYGVEMDAAFEVVHFMGMCHERIFVRKDDDPRAKKEEPSKGDE